MPETAIDRLTTRLRCYDDGNRFIPDASAVGQIAEDLRELLTAEAKQRQLLDIAGRQLQGAALDVTEPLREIAGLRAELDALAAERDQLRRQLEAAEAQPADREQLLTLIADLASDDECEYDRRGGCQTHSYLSLRPGELCPHAEARELLAARPGPLESAVTEALADIATDDHADPESARPAPPWLVEAGDD